MIHGNAHASADATCDANPTATPRSVKRRILEQLSLIYGPQQAPSVAALLTDILVRFRLRNPQSSSLKCTGSPCGRLSERDVILITYGDHIAHPPQSPLETLAKVLGDYVKGAVTTLHILPFFPYSSDDGFSVIDYGTVNPDLGTWGDIERLSASFRLMFDLVTNHVSAQSRWFREFLAADPKYAEYFITVEEDVDLSQVVRPRALPLLTRVQTARGDRLVWTTFSTDQIDLNYANPDVLLEIIEILLLYVEKGAEIIRLDAIAYLWKEIGTTCIHRPETHGVVKLLRAVLDAVAPQVILITETNVPHEENISYFGDGSDEAQMAYQFPLAPLVLHAIHKGDASYLSDWASELSTPSDSTTFFNFLASHDGIGVRPVEGILPPSEVLELAQHTLAHGGYVSYKTNPDGSQSVYELNISYFDALSDPNAAEPTDLQVRRFLASQAILLSMAGVPGIYVHSLIGSRSHHDGVDQTGRYRSINREKLSRKQLVHALADPASLRHQVFYPYAHLLRTRSAHPAFHPNGPQRVIRTNPSLFVLLRTAPDGNESVLCIHNVSGQEQTLQINLDTVSLLHTGGVHDLIGGAISSVDSCGALIQHLDPYQVLWLKGEER